MKTKTTITLVKKGSLLVLSTLIFAACAKDKSDPTPNNPNGKFAMIVSSPGATEFALLVNETKTATSKLLTYNTVVPYTDVKAGAAAFSFTKKDGTEVLAKISGTIKASSSYTLLVGDKSPKTSLILVEDDLSAPATDQAKVRFVNLSPDAGVLDLYVAGKTDTGLSKKAFKEVSAFINVSPAAELKFEVKENGKTEVLATLEKYKVEKGRIYTIWVSGVKGTTDATKLSLEATANK